MSLKILVFPFFIVIILTLIIGYIKPDVSTVLAKRAELGQKKETLSMIDETIQNIRNQNASINERRESEAFVQKYLPQTLEEERVLDTFNYLAGQSGVIITGVAVTENSPIEVEAPQVTYASSSFQAVVDAGVVGDAVPVEPPKRTVESYTASVQVVGAYANLKDFFARLNHTDRFHTTTSFGIAAREETKTEDEKNAYPADFLKGSFEADFVHFHPFRLYSVVDQPLFQQGTFDFSVVDILLNHTKSPLPTLEVGSTGKPNPFQ